MESEKLYNVRITWAHLLERESADPNKEDGGQEAVALLGGVPPLLPPHPHTP